jgi:hypothetical protein
VYYLIVPCRSEAMYRDANLFKMPNYEFAGIFGAHDFHFWRTAWSSDDDQHESGQHREKFAALQMDIRTLAAAVPLVDLEAIIAATYDNVPLVGRTELVDEHSGNKAILEYPVKVMNVTRRMPRFQVDTGPVVVPDFASSAARVAGRFDVAYIAFNRFDTAEFILRRPTPISSGAALHASTTDYSVRKVVPARNTFFTAAPIAESKAR